MLRRRALSLRARAHTQRLRRLATDAGHAAARSTQHSSNPQLRVLFFGSDAFALESLRAVLGAPGLVQQLQVVCPPDNRPAKSKSAVPAFLKVEAAKLGLTVHQTSPTTDFRMTGWELPAHPDGQHWDLGVVVSFGYFIPRRIIEQFRFGMINVHASLLPKFRGASPIQHALLHGERESGVTIIDVDPAGIDRGKMLSKASVPIGPHMTFSELHSALSSLGAAALVKTLSDLPAAVAAALPQPTLQPPAQQALPARSFPTGKAASLNNASTAGKHPLALAPRLGKAAGSVQWAAQSASHVFDQWRALCGYLPLVTNMRRGARVHRVVLSRLCAFEQVFGAQAQAQAQAQAPQAGQQRPSWSHMQPDIERLSAAWVPGAVLYDRPNNLLWIACGGGDKPIGAAGSSPNFVLCPTLRWDAGLDCAAKVFASGFCKPGDASIVFE